MKQNMWKNKKNNLIYGYVILLIFCSIPEAFAKSSSGYEQWKVQQQQHDQRLKQKTDYSLPQQRIVQVQPEQTTQTFTPLQTQQLGQKIQININLATALEISAKLDGIGHKKAQAIIAYRQQHGEFKKVDDLLNVKGIGDKTLAKNRDKIKLR